MATTRAIEVKVGVLILSAVMLLVGFVLVMGGIHFQPTYRVTVGFDNPGALQVGTPVRIAGVKVGEVEELTFNTSPLGQREVDTLIYLSVTLEERYRAAIHEDATFFITTQGVLGEQFLAIDPGSRNKPPLVEGSVVRGLDPPRLDRLLAEGYDLLHTAMEAVRSNKSEVGTMFKSLGRTLDATGALLERNQDRVDAIAENAVLMSEEGVKTAREVRRRYVENPSLERMLANLEAISAVGRRDVPILLRRSKSLLDHGDQALSATEGLLTTLGDEERLAQLDRLLNDLASAGENARRASEDATAITQRVRQGRGSVGALVMDEQLYDDLQELARDLKHNPWKFFWRE